MSIVRFALVALLPLTSIFGCSGHAPPEGAGEKVEASRAPIVGGLPDLGRSYVVGVADNFGPFCSGTLISRRTVLTAGHCFTPGMGKQGGILKILFGPDLTQADVKSVDTVKAVRHPGYNDNSLSNDLCLVELAADAPSQPVPLLRETMTNSPAYIGPDFTFVGYGDDGMGNYDLRRVVTFAIAAIGPANVGIDSGTGPIDKSMFYYAVSNKNTCNGDSGGPAFLVRKGVERLAGATSSGDDACTIDGTDARTDLPTIMAFIQPNLDQFEGMDPCRNDGVCDESCNGGGKLVDPDCAENHCGADGMCVISCVAPVDPDCAGVDHCGSDGVCDPSCAMGDPDCGGGTTTTGAGGGGVGGGATTGAGGTGGDGGAGGASTTTAGTSGATTSAGSGGGSSDEGGCGCEVAGNGSGERAAWWIAAFALALTRRRRALTITRTVVG